MTRLTLDTAKVRTVWSSRWQTTGWLTRTYLALVVIAVSIGLVRLQESTEMPGLAAIELVLLALPWSLGLGVAPLSHAGWFGMAASVILGCAFNVIALRWLEEAVRLRLRRGVPSDR